MLIICRRQSVYQGLQPAEFRQIPGVREVDFHFAGMSEIGDYREHMADEEK
jgi:hypothetical protein